MKPQFKEIIESPDRSETRDFLNYFDHTYGCLSGGGLFYWNNRFGRKTFIYSSDYGWVEGLAIQIPSGVYVRQADIVAGDEEYELDGWPEILSPSYEDMESLLADIFCNRINEKTWELINRYLTPDRSVDKDSIAFLLDNKSAFSDHSFVAYTAAMPYRDFLRTPYWRIIAWKVRKDNSNRCQLCGKHTNLEVHHLSYDIRGRELERIKDLTLLCHDCHSKFHNHIKE